MDVECSGRVERLVVGGGIVGLAVAYELARRGHSVLLLERDRPGSGATAAAAGMLAPMSEAEVQPAPLVALALDSLARWPEFAAGLERVTGASCGYRSEGTLWAALDRDGLAELEHLVDTLGRRGFPPRWLGAGELRVLEPHVSSRAVGGLLVPGDHQVDPRAVAEGLARAVRALGGRVIGAAQVEAIDSAEGRVRGVRGRRRDGSAFAVEAPCVILAAGAWTSAEIEVELPPLGLRPVKGQLVRLHGPRLLTRVLRTPEVYLVPRGDGELLVGATVEEVGFDGAPTAGAVMDLLRRAWEVVPGLYELELREVSVGFRPAVADHLPVIGATEIGGLYLACGHFRSGILLAPATAHYLVEWIESGVAPAALEPFLPGRLAPAGTEKGERS